MKIIKRIPAYYVAEEVEDLGWSYKWCPEQLMLECGACGTRTTFTRSTLLTSIVTCECGVRSSNTASAREELLSERAEAEDERIHPWRYRQAEENVGIPA